MMEPWAVSLCAARYWRFWAGRPVPPLSVRTCPTCCPAGFAGAVLSALQRRWPLPRASFGRSKPKVPTLLTNGSTVPTSGPIRAKGAVKDGVPLAITFAVQAVDGRSCVPLAGVVVDIWHCDALGVYSDVQDPGFNTVGQKFLRGYQVTDANGAANFVTIYPGWYQGRTVHVHFKLRTDPGAAQGFEFTSQLYFDDALTDVVHAQQPYAAKGQRTLRNSGDGIYRNGGSQLLLAPTADGTGGYRATFDIALEGASVPPTPTPIAAACSTIETCLADLQSVLPDPLAASSRKARSATRRLQRQALGVARRLARAAGSSGAAQVLEYLRARAALQRLLVLAQAADAKGALDVPLSQVESAVAALFDQLPS